MATSISQFPKPPKGKLPPIQGSYRRETFAPKGGFGAKEFGSTVAFSAAIQPAIIFASYQIEQMAEAANPSMNGYAAFGSAYISTFAVSVALKLLSGFLRNFGESLIRDLASWLWTHALKSAWTTATSGLLGWLPWRRRHQPYTPHPTPTNQRSRPVIRWWRNRRR